MRLSIPIVLFSLLFSLSLCLPSIPVSAHNWLWSCSRAELASSFYPWPPKTSPEPCMQVNPNQLFPVEHSIGHGNIFTLYGTQVFSYYVILNYDDQDQVPLTSATMKLVINDYLASAPPSSLLDMNQQQWRKFGMLPPTNSKSFQTNFQSITSEYFIGQVMPNDPRYRFRDPVALAKCKSNDLNAGELCTVADPPSQWDALNSTHADDIRAEYVNPNYPWIESITRIQTNPTETNFVPQNYNINLRIPARKGPGNYMVWFVWGGYYDVIDVSVVTPTVTHQFGQISNGDSQSYTRLDHCSFTTFNNPLTACRKVDSTKMDISQCVADCNSNPKCSIIQVSRKTNFPPPFPTDPVPPNIPILWWNTTQEFNAQVLGPCGWPSYLDRLTGGCTIPTPTCDISAIPDNDYVCWAAAYRSNPNLQATAGYEAVSEPEHPYFYNTCYFRSVPVDWDYPFTPYPSPEPSWIAGDQCVDCGYFENLPNIHLNFTPNWEGTVISNTEGKCTPCAPLS